MKAAILSEAGTPLRMVDLPDPVPGPGQLLLRVRTCGVCRTDLHVVDGELPDAKERIVPGHQIIGIVEAIGPGASTYSLGDRVGVPWLGHTCGICSYCRSERENLCEAARFTGYHIDGGFAELCVADERYCFPIPRGYSDTLAAPLLCAGLIGFRALRMAGDPQRIGFYGFGAAAHILLQVARYQGREVHAFTRPGDRKAQEFARSLGATWAGGSDEPPREPLDAAIVFAPVGALIPIALRAVSRGGTVVCAGIHMSDIPSFPYSILWGERSVRSVANLTRRDGLRFLALAGRIPIQTEVHPYSLPKANQALDDLRHGRFTGAAVVVVDPRSSS